MKRIFTPDSPYKKQARFLAALWTLLIFIGCFTPGKDIPKVDMPLIDKWTHLVLFGGFTFLWLCARPDLRRRSIVILLIQAMLMGAFIEVMQGALSFLGRSMELLDMIADSVGAAMGIGLFYLLATWGGKSAKA